MFGGAIKGGHFATNDLFLLTVDINNKSCEWKVIDCDKDNRPSSRYGHTLRFIKPNNLILFGGNLYNSIVMNDTWIFDTIENTWSLIEFSKAPPPRAYHILEICKSGKAKGMIMIFGGRSEFGIPLNDCWGLRKHRNGLWDWVKAPNRGSNTPISRYQHSAVFYNNLLIILGGRGNEDTVNLPIEVYDSNKLEWTSHFSFDKFRHVSWLSQRYIFTHGGCEFSNPLEPSNKIIIFDVIDILVSIKK